MSAELNLNATDQPTTCPIDGRRTVWLGDGTDDSGTGFHIEECTHCFRIYHVYEPEEPEHD